MVPSVSSLTHVTPKHPPIHLPRPIEAGITAPAIFSDVDQHFKGLTAKERTSVLSLLFEESVSKHNVWRVAFERSQPVPVTLWDLVLARRKSGAALQQWRDIGVDIKCEGEPGSSVNLASRVAGPFAAKGHASAGSAGSAVSPSAAPSTLAVSIPPRLIPTLTCPAFVAAVNAALPRTIIASHGQELQMAALVAYMHERMWSLDGHDGFIAGLEGIDEVPTPLSLDPSLAAFIFSLTVPHSLYSFCMSLESWLGPELTIHNNGCAIGLFSFGFSR